MTKRNTFFAALAVLFLFVFLAVPAVAQGLGLPGEDDDENKVIKTTVHAPEAFGPIFYIEIACEADSEAIHVYLEQSMYFEPTKLTGVKFLDKITASKTEDWEGQEVMRGKFSLRLYFELTGEAGSNVEIAGTLNYQGCEDDNSSCYYEDTAIDVSGVADPTAEAAILPADKPGEPGNGTTKIAPEQNNTGEQVSKGSGEAEDDLTQAEENWFDSLGVIPFVLMSFVVGLLLSVTPCILPLIPITAAIVKSFGKPTKSGAIIATLIYITGLVIVYAAVGTISALAGNTVSGVVGSPYVMGLFALVMVALALSMFGLYELKLPDRFTGKIQQASTKTKHNMIGLLLMGMLSGCIAGPCITGPLAGLLMSIMIRADVVLGCLSMTAVGIGMSALLFLAGAFNATLPKAGPWMRRVNVTFGFLLLIMAAYFARVIIGAEVFTLVTGLLIFAWTVFVGAWDSLTAESGTAARVLKAVGILAAVFGILMVLSGIISLGGHSPLERIERIEAQLRAMNSGVDIEAIRAQQFREGTKADVEAALKSGKPIILDFYGDNCTSCEALAEKLEDPDIVMALRNFETLRIHNTKNPDLALAHKVGNKVPIVVFIDSKGRVLKALRMSGAGYSVEQILEKIKKCEEHK